MAKNCNPTVARHDLIRARVQAQIERENVRSAERLRGLAYARAWRAQNKPLFDAAYGPELCVCGQEMPA